MTYLNIILSSTGRNANSSSISSLPFLLASYRLNVPERANSDGINGLKSSFFELGMLFKMFACFTKK